MDTPFQRHGRWLAALAAVAVWAAAAPADDAPSADKESERLQGTWTLARLEVDGNALPIEPATFRFEGKAVIGPEGNRIATFVLDPVPSPRIIDFEIPDGEDSTRVLEGIYELSDDLLRLCLNVQQQQQKLRPTEFATSEGAGLLLIELRRRR
jgi:uncharacterized protein (TIGR03067 family)